MKAELNDMDEREVKNYYYKIGDSNLRVAVGECGVTEIRYHAPQGEGDKHFVDVYYNDGNVARDFDMVSIAFKKDGI